METVGVLAVVEGVSQFIGDMDRINGAIDSLRPTTTLTISAFEGITGALGAFGREILNIAEITIGVLLRDAFNQVMEWLGQLASAVFDAAMEFQTLQLRLERLNFNSLIESGMDYNQAQAEAVRLTQEQLEWIQKLAAATPYDAQDVANTFTLARAYGMSADESQRLTENILNFASGMGLGNTEMERIIINFGQLIQQNKLNAQDLRDLARGAFVPINDVLERMAKNMGISVEELNKMRASGELGGDAVKNFIEAFNQLVEERFVGAAQKMSRTLQGATANFVDLFKSIVGFNVVMPIFDYIGGKIADFVEVFTGNQAMWDALQGAAKALGLVLTDIIKLIFDIFLPKAEDMAQGVLDGLRGLTQWLYQNKVKIYDFFIGLRDRIGEVAAWVRDTLIPIFVRIVDWVGANKELILGFFQALMDIVAQVLNGLTGGGGEGGGNDFLGSLLNAIQSFMEYVIENKDQIADWVETIAKIVVIVDAVVTATIFLEGVIGFLWSLVSGLIWTFIQWAKFFAGGIYTTLLFFFGVAAAIADLIRLAEDFARGWENAKARVALVGDELGTLFKNVGQAIGEWFTTAIENIKKSWDTLVTWVSDKFEEYRGQVEEALKKISSTVVEGFAGIGPLILEKFSEIGGMLVDKIGEWGQWIREGLGSIGGIFNDAFLNILQSIWQWDLWGQGYQVAQDLMVGLANGISDALWYVLDVANGVGTSIIETLWGILGIGSPSKVFERIGQFTMLGLAKGIENFAGMVSAAMGSAVAQVAAPAFILPGLATALAGGGNYNNQRTNNYNLTIHSNAGRESLVQDFGMLQSLQGG